MFQTKPTSNPWTCKKLIYVNTTGIVLNNMKSYNKIPRWGSLLLPLNDCYCKANRALQSSTPTHGLCTVQRAGICLIHAWVANSWNMLFMCEMQRKSGPFDAILNHCFTMNAFSVSEIHMEHSEKLETGNWFSLKWTNMVDAFRGNFFMQWITSYTFIFRY